MARLIQDHSFLKIVGTASDGREAVKQIEALQPDVVLMDITMPNLNGIEAARILSRVSPKTKVIILSMHENEEFLKNVLKAGAKGYLLKESTGNELILAIRAAHQGNVYLSPPLAARLLPDYLGKPNGKPGESSGPALSGREREILQLLAEGHSNKAIAKSLNLGLQTIETHRKNIMKKLNLHRIADLVRYAVRTGIIKS
jgi:DNA-binding NarL/FixJ family response regulator